MQRMANRKTYSRLALIAADQWGLVSRRQAEQAGVSPATLTRLVRDGVLERVTHGVFRLTAAPLAGHLELRAAWLQLAPEILAWERRPDQGVVSHRSAAELYGIGNLPADTHEFTLPERRQSRRPDVRLHNRQLPDSRMASVAGLPVVTPSRIASDLLWDREDPAAIAQIISEAIQQVRDAPSAFAEELGPHAAHFGLRRGDGLALLRWLLDLVDDANADRYIQEGQMG
jgi:predicted transcriptional regulator of viral defense system